MPIDFSIPVNDILWLNVRLPHIKDDNIPFVRVLAKFELPESMEDGFADVYYDLGCSHFFYYEDMWVLRIEITALAAKLEDDARTPVLLSLSIIIPNENIMEEINSLKL